MATCRLLSTFWLSFILSIVLSRDFLEHESSLNEEWEKWKLTHKKQYSSSDHEAARLAIWNRNRLLINRHNTVQYGFSVGMNHLGDLSLSEYREMFTCHSSSSYSSEDTNSSYSRTFSFSSTTTKADFVDWRENNVVTAVKNQGSYWCDACYAFSSVAALESHHAIKTGRLVALSEQNLIDCSRVFGNVGCQRGNYKMSYRYVIENEGINTESSYPYTATVNLCQYDAANIGSTMRMVALIEQGSEESLEWVVAAKGPVVVAVDHTSWAFQFYQGGVYRDILCQSDPSKLTHEMVVIGYGWDEGIPYWLLKNSYGTNWGINGYMMMLRNGSNMCGIASDAGFPII